MQQEIHVSITSLRIKRPWHIPIFSAYAIRSMTHARRAPGHLLAQARRINGVRDTLTLWTDRAAMRAYLTTGPHLQAMRGFPRIATGKVVGYPALQAPDWLQVHAIWRDQGRAV
ncbi:MAG: hypothetical protein ACK4HW_13230 [Roseinatronobacter sp.]